MKCPLRVAAKQRPRSRRIPARRMVLDVQLSRVAAAELGRRRSQDVARYAGLLSLLERAVRFEGRRTALITIGPVNREVLLLGERHAVIPTGIIPGLAGPGLVGVRVHKPPADELGGVRPLLRSPKLYLNGLHLSPPKVVGRDTLESTMPPPGWLLTPPQCSSNAARSQR